MTRNRFPSKVLYEQVQLRALAEACRWNEDMCIRGHCKVLKTEHGSYFLEVSTGNLEYFVVWPKNMLKICLRILRSNSGGQQFLVEQATRPEECLGDSKL